MTCSRRGPSVVFVDFPLPAPRPFTGGKVCQESLATLAGVLELDLETGSTVSSVSNKGAEHVCGAVDKANARQQCTRLASSRRRIFQAASASLRRLSVLLALRVASASTRTATPASGARVVAFFAQQIQNILNPFLQLRQFALLRIRLCHSPHQKVSCCSKSASGTSRPKRQTKYQRTLRRYVQQLWQMSPSSRLVTAA